MRARSDSPLALFLVLPLAPSERDASRFAVICPGGLAGCGLPYAGATADLKISSLTVDVILAREVASAHLLSGDKIFATNDI